MSRKTSTTPPTFPFSSKTGAAFFSMGPMGRSIPSREIRSVGPASLVGTPSSSARDAGFSTGARVSSLTMRKTRSSETPTASSCVQPVSAAATGFRKVTRPCGSVVITASPILESVTRSHSAESFRACMACPVSGGSPRMVGPPVFSSLRWLITLSSLCIHHH